MDATEKAELRDSLRALFAAARTETGAVAAELRDLGWDEVVAEDPSAVALLFEEQGRALVTSTLLDETVSGTLGLERTDTAVAYPLEVGDLWAPCSAAADVTGGLGPVVRTAGRKPERIVLPLGPTEIRVVPGSGVDLRPVAGLDPDGGWARLDSIPAAAAGTVLAASWTDAVAVARRALAAESVGLARAALALATAHVTERRQFGRSIGSFQAVRFRLADAQIAIESAAEAVRVAFATDSGLAAVAAKAIAARAVDSAVRTAAQVCGAMGMTWEFGLHRVIRRGLVLDQLLGDSGAVSTALGRHLVESAVESATLPLLDPLSIPLTR